MKFGGDGSSTASALVAALTFRREKAEVERTGRFILIPTGEEPRPCWHCGRPSRWLELNFEAPLHPGACSDAKDVEWWTALAAQRHAQPFPPTGEWPYDQGPTGSIHAQGDS